MTQVWSATQINSNLSGGGTTTVTSSGSSIFAPAYGSEGFSTGKYYWESKVATSDTSENVANGIGNVNSSTSNSTWIGSSTDTVGMLVRGATDLDLYWNGTRQFGVAGFTGLTESDRFAHALDLTNGLYWVSDVTAGSSWYGATSGSAGNPAAGTNGFNLNGTGVTVLSANVVPAINCYKNGDVGNGYFAQSSWIGTAPSGFGPFDTAILFGWEQSGGLIVPVQYRAVGGTPT